MAVRKRAGGRQIDDRARTEGFEELTASNADDQFAKFLAVLDRIEQKLFDLVVQMRTNRKEIEAGLERIGRRGDAIDRLLAGMK